MSTMDFIYRFDIKTGKKLTPKEHMRHYYPRQDYPEFGRIPKVLCSPFKQVIQLETHQHITFPLEAYCTHAQ